MNEPWGSIHGERLRKRRREGIGSNATTNIKETIAFAIKIACCEYILKLFSDMTFAPTCVNGPTHSLHLLYHQHWLNVKLLGPVYTKRQCSVKAVMMLVTQFSLTIMELLQMAWNPILKWLHCSQWELCRKRHCYIDTDAWCKWALRKTSTLTLVLTLCG